MNMVRQGVGLACGIILATGLNLAASAQVRALAATELVAVETAVPDTVARLAADAKNLPAVSPSQLPRHGTYWIVTGDGSFLMPMPFLPHDQANAPIFSLGSPGQFLVDGSGGVAPRPTRNQAARGITAAVLLERQGNAILDLLDQLQAADLKAQQAAASDTLEMSSGKMSKSVGMSRMSLSSAGGNELNSLESFIAYGTNLWLEIPVVTNGAAYVVLHNAIQGEVYELMTKVALTDPVWNPELALHPVLGQDWIGMAVPMLKRTNALFFWARDWTGIDENTNSLPDWWEWENFGNLNQTANGDYDGDGVSNWDEYNAGTDPNTIRFSIRATNNYVRTSFPPLHLTVSKGVPDSMAILVDSNNFGGATWVAYNSNPTATLSGEGWHQVWIGLRGRQATLQQTWQGKRLKLDTSPPKLVITNPVASAVSQPMIQIQGFSPEALREISCDISNSVGVLTNQQVLIVGQYEDTNTFEITTNFFQAFDIELTNGFNTITFHATDKAGNVTTTNFNFTLDYSSKTNPPVIELAWPQQGAKISGGSFTMDGQLDDPTAVVTAQIANTNGATNTVRGLVERNGKFWVQNLPLSSGTNSLALTVTDAAGNSSVTNISVVQSALVLTMNPVPDSQLWQHTVSLTGTISVSTCAVWANGLKGVNGGDGTWSASNVPVTEGGTASFKITAYAPDEQQPDGSYGN